MNKYEVLYIIDRDVVEEKREAMIAAVTSSIDDKGGVVASVEKWGMKKFAYTINFKNEGYYVLMAFESAPDTLKEMERRMGIADGLIRYMVTSVVENKKTIAQKERQAKPVVKE